MGNSSSCGELTGRDGYLSEIYFPPWRLDRLRSFLAAQQKSSDKNITYQYKLDSDNIKVTVINKSENTNISLVTNEHFKIEWNKEFLKNFTVWTESHDIG